MRNEFVSFSIISVFFVMFFARYIWPPFWWAYLLLIPLLLLGYYDFFQKKNTILRNYPLLGRGRFIMEELRPKIYQYFIESDTNGKPVSRMFREVIYQRSTKDLDTQPFGTQFDVYDEGYEWMNHSIAALDAHKLNQDPRIVVGSSQCTTPYAASLLNISAMSFGSLSKNAIKALNLGAKAGGFAHNTGEGGISPYHKSGGDLIFQIGTAYFGCRDKDGRFSPELFREEALTPEVKMIEVKLSQGAKPGHGGILPAVKNTPEIAAIRKVEPHTTVASPPFHTAFNTPIGLLEFLQQLRELSGGKPVGFKLCIGRKSEFLAICKAMVKTGIYPDFITIDGGEGGTGAAPLEFSNSVGMPFREGLAFAYDALCGFDLKKEIKLFASGKIFTAFHLFRALAIGADACNSARGMMLALGCIHALECNNNTCPTGVATQNPELIAGLVVKDKQQRITNFQRETIEAFVELLAAAGLHQASQIGREHIYRRISRNRIMRYDEIFPYLDKGCLLHSEEVPPSWRRDWEEAFAEKF